jgi:phosphodiesterase/alkaline phosphatase D-like protein
VATAAATGVWATGATLRGSVNPEGCATTYRFEYGTTTAYGSALPMRSAGAGTSSVVVAAGISWLAPNTVYHFRITATSGAGTTAGHDVAFETKTACVRRSRPTVVTAAATGVASTGATLGGRVNPHGCAAIYRFEYGTTTAYRSVTRALSPGSSTSPVPVTAAITGLAPSTVYHFRIVARSAGGTTVGRDMVFKTLAPPASLVGVVGHRASVRRRFIAFVRLRCFGGGQPCEGSLKLFRKHRLIGIGHFSLAPNSTAFVAVKLNRRGRRLMHQHRRRRVEVVARSANNRAIRFITLIRRFPVH